MTLPEIEVWYQWWSMVIRGVVDRVIGDFVWLGVRYEVRRWRSDSISEVPKRGTSSYGVELRALGLSVFQRIGL